MIASRGIPAVTPNQINDSVVVDIAHYNVCYRAIRVIDVPLQSARAQVVHVNESVLIEEQLGRAIVIHVRNRDRAHLGSRQGD